jgi:hypothetical protein
MSMSIPPLPPPPPPPVVLSRPPVAAVSLEVGCWRCPCGLMTPRRRKLRVRVHGCA